MEPSQAHQSSREDQSSGDESRPAFDPLFVDPVIEVYKKDVDLAMLDRMLSLSVAERAQQLVNVTQFLRKFRPLVQRASQDATLPFTRRKG